MPNLSKHIMTVACVWMVALAGCSSPVSSGGATSPTSSAPVNTTTPMSSEAKLLIHITTTSDWTNIRVVRGGTLAIGTNLLSSPEATVATIDGNLISLSQPLARAEAGEGVEMSLDVLIEDLSPNIQVVFEVQRGFVGSTQVELSTYAGGQALLLKTFTWSETNKANGNVLEVQILAADLLTPPTAALAQPTSIPNNNGSIQPSLSSQKLRVIYDDDGSRDGTAALLYLLSRPEVSIDAISVSYGEAHPKVYIQHIGHLLASLGIQGIPLGAGQDAPLAGGMAFPDWLRQLSSSFWNIPLPNAGTTVPFEDAPKLMVSTINQASEPVTLLVIGPFTNLAKALRMDPGIRKKIAAVYIMGGAVHSPGNIGNLIQGSSNKVAEWNIYADPQAAKEAFDAGLNMYLVPLDATSQVLFRKEDIASWHRGNKAAQLVAQLYDIMFNEYGFKELDVFDLTAAVMMVNPELCAFELLHLDVVTDAGNTTGQTLVVPNGEQNIHVCLAPRVDLTRQQLNDTFSTPH
jgi:pyrimidine-specific ribonucleoside hydrolase